MALSVTRPLNGRADSAADCLSKILASKGLEKNDLAFPLTLDPCLQTWIAVRIGDWKCCAAYLGVPQQDIDDMVQEDSKERNRRIAMLRRWSQLKGQEATCIRLLEVIAEMGRNDLVESLLDIIVTKVAESRRICQDQEDIDKAARHVRYTLYHALLLLLQAIKYVWKTYARFLFMVLVLIILSSLLTWDQRSASPYYRRYRTQNIEGSNFAKINDTSKFEVANTTTNQHECPVDSDLPIINSLFVGRDSEMLEIIKKFKHAHIIGINGPPGFGKSSLAIHFGYDMVKRGTSV